MNDQQSLPSRLVNAQKCVTFKVANHDDDDHHPHESGVCDNAEEENRSPRRGKGLVVLNANSDYQVQIPKASSEQKCADSGRIQRKRCGEISKQNKKMSQQDQQLEMKMSNEASPSKPTAGVSHADTIRSDAESDLEDDDILIRTDSEESDSQIGFVNLRRKSRTEISEKRIESDANKKTDSITKPIQEKLNQNVHSSTPAAKKTSSRRKGTGRERRSKQLKIKTKRTLSKGRAASSRLRQAEEKDDDSDWESAPEMEISEIKQRLRGFDANQLLGQDSMTSDGRLLIDIDEDSEEIEEYQIPMKQQLEKTIADGCAKNNLSVNNVKKILRSLVTHDLVKEMLKTTLKSSSEDVPPGAIVYEPKLTRSKMKEVLEKGKDPGLWPVSPVKLGQPASSGPSILDVEFAEEEDDEDDEYNPSKDAEEVESDDESITSSQVSDFGSPFPLGSPVVHAPSTPVKPTLSRPSTPSCSNTPTATAPSRNLVASSSAGKKDAQSGGAVNQMGPPIAPAPSIHSTRQRLVFASPEKKIEEDEEDGIARRTRSKLPLTTTSLFEIEDAFVAPDITPDMYDTTCDDTDWQDFLKHLHNPGGSGTQNESMEVGEEDDPEFNYIAEAETEEFEAEEIRFDGPFRISRKELNTLMEELEDLFNEEDYSMIGLRTNLASAHENIAHFSKKSTSASDQSQELASPQPSRRLRSQVKEPKVVEESAPPFTPMVLENQKQQIEQQIRQHIQLITQMFVLAQGHTVFKSMADECKTLLSELDRLRNVSRAGSKSVYNVYNLSGALDLVNRDIDWESHRLEAVIEGTAPECQVLPTSSQSSALTQTAAHLAHTLPSCSAQGSSLDKKISLFRQCPQLLKIQKEVFWNSAVFLYPRFLPSVGLLPKSAFLGYSSKAYYTPSEDNLLVRGKEQFKHMKGKVYQMIQTYMLPTKTPLSLRLRFSKSTRRKVSVFQKYHETGEVPPSPQNIEEFSEKAPCQQPVSVLPRWCKVWKSQESVAKQKQEKAERLKRREKELARNKAKMKREQNRNNGRLVLRDDGHQENRKRKKCEVQKSSSEKEPEDGEIDNESDSDYGSVSSHRPPSKRQRRCETQSPARPLSTSSSSDQRINIISSVLSPSSSDKPSALVTSKGIYVPLTLADPAKVNAVLAKCGYTAVNELGERQTVTTEQLFGSNPVVHSGSLSSSIQSSSSHSRRRASASCEQKQGRLSVDSAIDEVSDNVEHSAASLPTVSVIDLPAQSTQEPSIESGDQQVSQFFDQMDCGQINTEQMNPQEMSCNEANTEQSNSEQNSEQVKSDQFSCEQMSIEQLSCDKMNTMQMNSEQMSTDNMSRDQTNPELLSCDEINTEQMSCHQMDVEQMNSEKMSCEQLKSKSDCEQIGIELTNSKPSRCEPANSKEQIVGHRVNDNPHHSVPSPQTPVSDNKDALLSENSECRPLCTHNSLPSSEISQSSPVPPALPENTTLQFNKPGNKTHLGASEVSEPSDKVHQRCCSVIGDDQSAAGCEEGLLNSDRHMIEIVACEQQHSSLAPKKQEGDSQHRHCEPDKLAETAPETENNSRCLDCENGNDKISDSQELHEDALKHERTETDEEMNQVRNASSKLQLQQDKVQQDSKEETDRQAAQGHSVLHCREIVPDQSLCPNSESDSQIKQCIEPQRAGSSEEHTSKKACSLGVEDKLKSKSEDPPGFQIQQCTSTISCSKKVPMDEDRIELNMAETASIVFESATNQDMTETGSVVTDTSESATNQDLPCSPEENTTKQQMSSVKNSPPPSPLTIPNHTTGPSEEKPQFMPQRCKSAESPQITSMQLSPLSSLPKHSTSPHPTNKPDCIGSTCGEKVVQPVPDHSQLSLSSHRSRHNPSILHKLHSEQKSLVSVVVSSNLSTYSDHSHPYNVDIEGNLSTDTSLGCRSTESSQIFPHKLNPPETNTSQKQKAKVSRPFSPQVSGSDHSYPDSLQEKLFARHSCSSGGTATTQTITLQKHKSVEPEVKLVSPQEQTSAGVVEQNQLDSKSQHVYQFHINADSGELMQSKSSSLSTSGEGSNLQQGSLPPSPPPPPQDKTPGIHLDVICAAMEMMLGKQGKKALCVPNGTEGVNIASKSRIPISEVSLSSLPSIVNTASGVNITVNMLYTSDYAHEKASTSSDDHGTAAEDPSSTTPDGAEDGQGRGGGGEATSQQGEVSHHQGDRRNQRASLSHSSPLSDDAVSTTSDIGGENLESGADCVENSGLAAVSHNLNMRSDDGSANLPGCSLEGEHSGNLNLLSISRPETAGNSKQEHTPGSPHSGSSGSSSLQQLPLLTFASTAGDSSALESGTSQVPPGSPHSESVGSSSLSQLPVSLAPMSVAGDVIALNSVSSDPSQSHESLCTVSSSSPLSLRRQRRRGLRCEDLHSEETIQFHIGGFESFFEVSSSGIELQGKGNSPPLGESGGDVCSEPQQNAEQSLTGSGEITPSGGENSVTEKELCDIGAMGFSQADSIASHSASSQLADVRMTPLHNSERTQIPQPGQVTVSQVQGAVVQPATVSSYSASDSISSQPPPATGGSLHYQGALSYNTAAVTAAAVVSAGESTTTTGTYNDGIQGPSVSTTTTFTTTTTSAPIPSTYKPHSSWSGLSSVCHSANFGFIVSVVVPSEEEGEVSMETGDISALHEGEEKDSCKSFTGHPSESNEGDAATSMGQDPDSRTDRSQFSRASQYQAGDSPGPALSASQAQAESSLPHEHAQADSEGSASPVAIDSSREMPQSQSPLLQPPHNCDSASESSVARNESLTIARGSSLQDAGQDGRYDDTDRANRQALLQLINSASSVDNDENPIQQDAALLHLGIGVSTRGSLPAHQEGEDVEEFTHGMETSFKTPPSSPPWKKSRIQAENEKSPSRVMQHGEERSMGLLFENPSPLPLQSTHSLTTRTSAEFATQDNVPYGSPTPSHVTPGVPSSLRLVSVAAATQHINGKDSRMQNFPGDGGDSVEQRDLPQASSSHPQSDTKVLATLTPVLYSSPTETPTTYTLLCTEPENPTSSPTPAEPQSPSQFSSASSLPVLAPKPGPVVYPSPPRLPQRQRGSPKKHQLQKQVRSILPKGYTYEMRMMSPTKAAARTLKKKATLFCQRSPSKTLLPKDPNSAAQQSAQNGAAVQAPSSTLPRWNQRGMNLRNRALKKKEAEATAQAAEKKSQHASQHPKGNEEGSQEESDETGSELEDVAMLSQEDSQNEEEGGETEDDRGFLNNLMAASSTIGFKPFKKSDKCRSQQEIRKEEKLALLAPDILETDPRKDERDTSCAQAYLNKLKVLMQKDPTTYTSFMDLVRQFDMNQLSPVQVYDSLTQLLAKYPELLEDFAAFLLPTQALHTGCPVSNQLSTDVRTFLRKLELHYDKAEAKYQQILRTLGKWDFKTKSPAQLQQTVLPLLRSMPRHMHADFLRFFPDLAPPESHMEQEDFEDISLGDKPDGDRSPDDFEDVQYPDENDPYRTKRCPCSCHQEAPMAASSRKHTKGNRDRITHCYSCCLKVVGGQLYFQPSNVTTRRPVSATFHAPVPMPLPPDLPPPDLLSSHRTAYHRHQSAAHSKDSTYYGDNNTKDDDVVDEDVDEDHDERSEEKKIGPNEDPLGEQEDDEEEDEEEENTVTEEEGVVVQEAGTSASALTTKYSTSSTVQESVPTLSLISGSGTCTLASSLQEMTQHPKISLPPQSPREILVSAVASSSLTVPSSSPVLHKTGHSFSPMPGHPTSPLHPMQVATPCPVQPVAMASFSPLPPTQRLVSPQVLPAARPADFQHSRHIIPTPLGHNSRMRKRVLSMRPGCQVSSFMHSVAGRSRSQQPQPQRDVMDMSQTPTLAGSAPVPVVPLSPGGAGGGASPGATSQLLSSPRILQSDREWGTLSVKGPDNTVIMFNSSLPSPALADTLPGLHEQSPFFSPLPPPASAGAGELKGTAREARAGVGSGRGGGGAVSEGGGVLLARSTEEHQREEEHSPPPSSHLPTITSPGKNIQQGSFAGLLQKSRKSDTPPAVEAVVPLHFSSSSSAREQKGGKGGSGEEEQEGKNSSPNSTLNAGSLSCLAPVPPQPLMSDDTINALFEQMREGGEENSCSLSLTQHAGCSALCAPSPPSSPPQNVRTGEQPGAAATVAAPALSAGLSHSIGWSREQDKLILETVRDHGDSHDTYVQIAAKLQNVTPQQVADRLSTLMELLNSSEEETDDDNFMDVE